MQVVWKDRNRQLGTACERAEVCVLEEHKISLIIHWYFTDKLTFVYKNINVITIFGVYQINLSKKESHTQCDARATKGYKKKSVTSHVFC